MNHRPILPIEIEPPQPRHARHVLFRAPDTIRTCDRCPKEGGALSNIAILFDVAPSGLADPEPIGLGKASPPSEADPIRQFQDPITPFSPA
jgi:hypothetical protein